MSDKDWRRTSTRVADYELDRAKDYLDQAFWQLETDPVVLKDANRPLLNNGEKAKELLYAALETLEHLEDLPLSRLDMVVWDIECATEKLGKKEIEIYVKDSH